MKMPIHNPQLVTHRSHLKPAFTLVELLAVVTIIVLLIAMLLPSLSVALEQARKAKCLAQLRNIGFGMELYRLDFQSAIPARRNWARWADETDPNKVVAPEHANAYWGVGYAPYGTVKENFACPTAYHADAANGETTYEGGLIWITYGFNGAASTSATATVSPFYTWDGTDYRGARKAQIPNQASMVVAMDSWETMLDNNGDYPFFFDQWYTSEIRRNQYFRHMVGTNLLWADGHVSYFKPENAAMPYSIGSGYKTSDSEWNWRWFLVAP